MTLNSEEAVNTLVQDFFHLYPGEIAKQLEALPVNETIRLLKSQAAGIILSVFRRLTPELAAQVIEKMDDTIVRQILIETEPHYVAEVLSRLDIQVRDRHLKLLDPGIEKELRAFMTYPHDSAGGLMDTKVMTLSRETTVRETLSKLRKFQRRRLVNDIFLIDENGCLIGVVSLQDIAISSPSTKLEQIKQASFPFVQSTASREEVVEKLSKRRLASIPVVDFEGRILGVIRYNAIVEAVQEEASADIQTMVGVSKDERALSKVSFAVRKRLPWLEVNLATAFLAAAVVGLFEDTIAKFTALAVLLPVVAGQSGNTGAQALAVTMRGLVLREIRIRQWFRISFKEFKVGLLNGFAVAVTTSFFVFLWSKSMGLTFIIGLSMILSMAIAGLAGAAVPLVLTRLGQDPAQSSSIILTTVTDVVGFFSFLGIATLLSNYI